MIAGTKQADFLADGYANVTYVLEKFVAGSYWQVKLLFFSLLLIFVQVTPFFNFQYFGEGSSWHTILGQANELLVPVREAPGSHGANKVFRLTVPLLAKLLSLNKLGLYVSQVLCGIALLYLLIRKTYRIVDDRVATILFMTAFTACYASYSAFYDVFGRIDAFGYLLILLSVYVRNPVAVFGCCTLTAWADERGLINTFFTALYWLYVSTDRNGMRLAPYPRLNNCVVAVSLSWIGYFAGRWVLSHVYHFQTELSGVGLDEFSKARHYIPIGVFSTYGAVWFVPILALVSMANRGNWLLLSLIKIGALANLAVMLMVTDINRSLAYTLPFVIMCLVELSHSLKIKRIRKLFFIACVGALLLPVYDFDGYLHYHPNLLIRIITLLLGVD